MQLVQKNTVQHNNIRPVYLKLNQDFHVLTKSFGIALPEKTLKNLYCLILAIECVDRILDEIPDAADRRAFCDVILDFLVNDISDIADKFVTKELETRLTNLKSVIWEIGVTKAFADVVRQIFSVTEKKRHEHNSRRFVELVSAEGVLTSQLPLLVMQRYQTMAFRHLFQRLCRIMGLVDGIIDLKKDYYKSEISLVPSMTVRINLTANIFKDTLIIFLKFPKPLNLFRYCCSFLLQLSKS